MMLFYEMSCDMIKMERTPTDIQYRNRSAFNLISLIPFLVAMGLYVPTYRFVEPFPPK